MDYIKWSIEFDFLTWVAHLHFLIENLPFFKSSKCLHGAKLGLLLIFFKVKASGQEVWTHLCGTTFLPVIYIITHSGKKYEPWFAPMLYKSGYYLIPQFPVCSKNEVKNIEWCVRNDNQRHTVCYYVTRWCFQMSIWKIFFLKR